MSSARAISQILATAVIIAIILAAFAGYAVSSFTAAPRLSVTTATVSLLIRTTVPTTVTVTTSNPSGNFSTFTIDCAGVPVCGISSAYSYTDNTTTVVIFVYPGSGTTSFYTLTETHETSHAATNT